MFIASKKALVLPIYIFFVIIVLSQYLQYLLNPQFLQLYELFITKNSPNLQKIEKVLGNERLKNSIATEVSFKFIIKNHTKYCYYRWRNFVFTVDQCQAWKLGSVAVISGSYSHHSATILNNEIRLKTQAIDSIKAVAVSDKSLNTFFWVFFEHFSILAGQFKHHLLSNFAELNSTTTEALIRAMVFGDKSLVDPTLYHFFETTGMLHILAVSGMHVGLLYLITSKALGLIWPILRDLTQVTLLTFYALLVGLGPSVLRATTMLVMVMLLKKVLKRQKNSWFTLIFSVFALLLFNDWLLFMVGFQLSVLATASIIWLNDLRIKLNKHSSKDYQSKLDNQNSWSILFSSVDNDSFTRDREAEFHNDHEVKEVVLTSHSRVFVYWVLLLAVAKRLVNYFKEIAILSGFIQLMLAPVLWYYFGKLSWVGVIASPLLMWLLPPFFLMTLLASLMIITSSTLDYFGLFFLGALFNIIKIFCSVVLEIIAHTFVWILQIISQMFDSVALIEPSNFKTFYIFLWYFVVFSLISIFLKVKTNGNQKVNFRKSYNF
jgi:ComEC/Rec2-related protein